VDKDVIVGALPLKNLGHLELLEAVGVSGVLSIVEPFELSAHNLFTRPILPNEWPKSIAHKQLPVPDYSPISLAFIQEAIEYIDELRGSGPVYVHCKAGRGRSVVIVLCYLLHKHPSWTLDQALEHVKKARPHICPNPEQLKAVRSYKEASDLHNGEWTKMDFNGRR